MKYVVLLGDGMADCPVSALGGKTPLEAANKPNMDFLARNGDMGLVKTIPDGMPPGSDVANLSVFGYEPGVYYTGRSPFEAASMGISMTDTDIALRCNLVTLSPENLYEEKTMVDYSSGEITTKEAHALIKTIAAELNSESFSFYSGIATALPYLENERKGFLYSPHDISGKITSFLPKGEIAKFYIT